jgi:pre-mRNA-processing factor 40
VAEAGGPSLETGAEPPEPARKKHRGRAHPAAPGRIRPVLPIVLPPRRAPPPSWPSPELSLEYLLGAPPESWRGPPFEPWLEPPPFEPWLGPPPHESSLGSPPGPPRRAPLEFPGGLLLGFPLGVPRGLEFLLGSPHPLGRGRVPSPSALLAPSPGARLGEALSPRQALEPPLGGRGGAAEGGPAPLAAGGRKRGRGGAAPAGPGAGPAE